jgi:hypothetical protein
MTRRVCTMVPLVLLVLSLSIAAFAEPFRTAQIGDRIGSLLAGLRKVDAGPVGSCPDGKIVGYVDYVVPGRTPDDHNASFVGFTVGSHVVIVVAYDENDLSAPVNVYADMEGKGLITDVWPVDTAPSPCAIMQHLRYDPQSSN